MRQLAQPDNIIFITTGTCMTIFRGPPIETKENIDFTLQAALECGKSYRTLSFIDWLGHGRNRSNSVDCIQSKRPML